MQSWKPLQSGTSLGLALSVVAGAAAPLVQMAPSYAQTRFSDVAANYWATPYVEALATRGVISGFPDGTFRPNAPVTRAQFAAMLRQAFSQPTIRGAARFNDVPSNYWAASAIQEAYGTGFLSGYPGNVFNPELNIPRTQVLVSLANGLNYEVPSNPTTVLRAYSDASAIPDYAINSVAAATEGEMVVNFPDVRSLNPNRAATRAEVAAFIYQALVNAGEVAAIPSPYVVSQSTVDSGSSATIAAGSTIAIRYDEADRILISPEEPEPVPVTLTVSRNVVNSQQALLIPAGSTVSGVIRPVEVDGEPAARFFAEELVLTNGRRYRINATSSPVTTTETIRSGASVVEILQGAALGAGAAAAIAGVTGDRAIATEEVLGGAGLGAIAGIFLGRDRAELLVIDPDADLNLTINENLSL